MLSAKYATSVESYRLDHTLLLALLLLTLARQDHW